MNIYVNGDSFASGCELADTVLPGFLGYKNSVKGDNNSKEEIIWMETRVRQAEKYYGSYENYITAGKQLAWPAELTKIDSSITVINGSKEGASMTGIAHRTIADLLEAREKDIKFDHVFIQLTSCARFEIYNIDCPKTSFIEDRALNCIGSLHASEKELAKNYILQYKNPDHAIKFLYNLCTLKHAIKGLTGFDPIIISPVFLFTKDVTDSLEKINDPIIQNLLKDSGILNIPLDCYMTSIQRENNCRFLPLNHFEQKTHQLYARVIYDKYLNRRDCCEF